MSKDVSNTPDDLLQEKINEIHELFGRNLLSTYYRVGQVLVDVIEDEKAGGSRYGKAAMERISEEFGMSRTNLYRCQEVAVTFQWEEIQQLVDKPNIKWCHLRESVRVPDKKARLDMLTQLADKPMTVKDFKSQVDVLRESTPDTSKKEGSNVGTSRTGTGHGPSPLTPIKQVSKCSAQLSSALKDSLAMVTEFDPPTTAIAERVTDALGEALDAICGMALVAVGFASEAEKHMASFSDKERGLSQDQRSSDYEQVSLVLRRLSAAIDNKELAPAQPIEQPVPTQQPERVDPPQAPPPAPVPQTGQESLDKEAIKEEMREKARAARARAAEKRNVTS